MNGSEVIELGRDFLSNPFREPNPENEPIKAFEVETDGNDTLISPHSPMSTESKFCFAMLGSMNIEC